MGVLLGMPKRTFMKKALDSLTSSEINSKNSLWSNQLGFFLQEFPFGRNQSLNFFRALVACKHLLLSSCLNTNGSDSTDCWLFLGETLLFVKCDIRMKCEDRGLQLDIFTQGCQMWLESENTMLSQKFTGGPPHICQVESYFALITLAFASNSFCSYLLLSCHWLWTSLHSFTKSSWKQVCGALFSVPLTSMTVHTWSLEWVQ